MALNGHKDPNLSSFHVGSTKEEVEFQLGPPKETHPTDYGARTDFYEYEVNNEPSGARAVMYLIYDIFTFGISEIVFTAAELMTGENKRLPIYYGADGRVAGINETAPEIPTLPAAINGQPRKPEIVQPLMKDLTTQLSIGIKERGINRIAILPLADAVQRTDTPVGNHLTDKLTNEFYRTGSLTVIERPQLQKLTDELSLTARGAFDDTSVKRIGGLLGVDAVVMGSYTELGSESVEVNARVVKVETAEIAGVGTVHIPRTAVERLLQSKTTLD
ncbi:MAG TPA: FlgO family outer membrane protein [Nitrospira sp.]|nr:FlgO family outer membrane protein [Nitrospira sp.]